LGEIIDWGVLERKKGRVAVAVAVAVGLVN
jgi:hypothetical protein